MNDVIDETQVNVNTDQDEGAEPSTEANASGSSADEEELPFDKHPRWKAARATESKVQSIMKEHGYDDLEEMVADIATSKNLQREVGTTDVKQLLAGQEAQKELAKIKAYWAEQKLLKEMEQRDDELPEDTVERLKKQMLNMKKEFESESQNQKKQEEDKIFWSNYEKQAKSFIESQTDITEAGKETLNALLRNETFINDIDLNKKSDIKRMNQSALELIKKLEDNAIKDYIAGKKKMPKISSTDETVTSLKEKPTKNLNDAKAHAIELLRKTHGFK